jgi:tartrate dehydrogenase/decarboxylase/D-malate dehydrogenase
VPEGGLLTSVTKSNALPHTMGLWDDVTAEVAARHPDTRWERMHVDAVAYQMVRAPERFDVLVASNLFGDILSDLGAGLQGTLGLAASGNVNPQSGVGIFEPIHGSAPDIAGRGVANPLGAINSAAMLLDHIGRGERGRAGAGRGGRHAVRADHPGGPRRPPLDPADGRRRAGAHGVMDAA